MRRWERTARLLRRMAPLAAVLALVAALASSSQASPAYVVGRDYPAGDGMVAVIGEQHNVMQMTPEVSGAWGRYHRELEVNPEAFTGMYPAMSGHGCSPGMALVVGVVRGRWAEARARMEADGLPSTCAQRVWLQESDQSSAARLWEIFYEVYDTIEGATAAGIDWQLHQVVVEILVDDVTDALRRQAFDLYGSEVAFRLVYEGNRML